MMSLKLGSASNLSKKSTSVFRLSLVVLPAYLFLYLSIEMLLLSSRCPPGVSSNCTFSAKSWASFGLMRVIGFALLELLFKLELLELLLEDELELELLDDELKLELELLELLLELDEEVLLLSSLIQDWSAA